MPWKRSSRIFRSRVSSSRVTIPPSPVVMFLIGWNEKIAGQPNPPAWVPRHTVPMAWAASSITATPFLRATSSRGAISAGAPAKWTGITAFVRGVIAPSTSDTFRFRVS